MYKELKLITSNLNMREFNYLQNIAMQSQQHLDRIYN